MMVERWEARVERKREAERKKERDGHDNPSERVALSQRGLNIHSRYIWISSEQRWLQLRGRGCTLKGSNIAPIPSRCRAARTGENHRDRRARGCRSNNSGALDTFVLLLVPFTLIILDLLQTIIGNLCDLLVHIFNFIQISYYFFITYPTNHLNIIFSSTSIKSLISCIILNKLISLIIYIIAYTSF